MNKDNEAYLKLFWARSNNQKTCFLSKKTKTTAIATTVFVLFCFVVTFCAFASWNMSTFAGFSTTNQNLSMIHIAKPQEQEFPLRCIEGENVIQTCPKDYYPTSHKPTSNHSRTCPSYFKWIYEDLRAWREKGITREMLEGARKTAYFRVVILEGKMYVEKYKKSFQTRDVFTLWGILQLMRLYPGKLPDLELLFYCSDRPVIPMRSFKGPNATPPPSFGYSSDKWSWDIVFPDWSFWGWAETNIKPWREVLKDIRKGNKKTKWKDRVPYAYWKGNPDVAPTRKDLMKCNVTPEYDWKTHLYRQDWRKESHEGYKESNLGDQCTHRKIYIEGWAWSVSQKYILACDAMNLYVKPNFNDFFSRGMVPLQHYWPIREDSKCTSLKFAVEWGNNHTDKAQEIGEAASKFIQEDLDMDYVYDYMFHLLNEYAKLQRFKPTIPSGAVEFCPEIMACALQGTQRRFMEDSMVKFPSDSNPCTIPPPYDPITLQRFLENQANLTRQVEIWEDEYWEDKKKGQ
ncbi:protein O-glucosyltransferase 1-like [Abrus precatorius]|uniref:Protein O-glucosyltransferase 1-like n=1 Tax=Abrus precatorius TaxID=3816 RepID=A0A8B8JZG5_ABRPR|nr:protein O-glucosyltransferase 1-like [Abrus precatorius]